MLFTEEYLPLPSHSLHSPILYAPASIQLVISAVDLLKQLPDLCSARGSLAIVPSLLYLSTGVLKETAVKSMDPVQVSGPDSHRSTALLSSALSVLKSLCAHPYARDARCAKDWTRLLQSAMVTILNYAKSNDFPVENDYPGRVGRYLEKVGLNEGSIELGSARPIYAASGLDESTAMMTLTVFLLTAPAEVTCVSELLQPSIQVTGTRNVDKMG
jgi:hypothetical protein